MTRVVTRSRLSWLSILAFCVSTCSVAQSQDEPPAAERPSVLRKEDSPLVKEPTTPDELFDAILIMLDLGRTDLAKTYLDKLLESPPDEAGLNELRDKYGSAAFLRIVNVPELRATGTTLLNLSDAAMQARAADPQRLVDLLSKLVMRGESEAEAAREFRALGVNIVPGLLTILDDDKQASYHPAAQRALLVMGSRTAPALVAALESESPAIRTTAASLLGTFGLRDAAPYLYYSAFKDESQAVQTAAREALGRILRLNPVSVQALESQDLAQRLLAESKRFSAAEYKVETDHDGLVSFWVWDSQERTLVQRKVQPRVAGNLLATRFVRQSLSLIPERRDTQVQYLTLLLGAEARAAGVANRLPRGKGSAHELALSVGPEVLGEVLLESLKTNRPASALAALEILQQSATLEQLRAGNVTKAPLQTALNSPDRRVQFSAAVTVLRLDPDRSFVGSERIVNVLIRCLNNSTESRAVVAQASTTKATELGGYVSILGYQPDVTFTGREAFQTAASRQDVTLVVLHANITRWALSDTIANLRADSRTAGLPILIVGPENLRAVHDRFIREYGQIAYIAEVARPEDFEQQVRPFLNSLGTTALSQAELNDYRGAALAWLARLADSRRHNIYDIGRAENAVINLLQEPELVQDALQVLGETATPGSQTALARLASDQQAEPVARSAAAIGLADHIKRFGLMVKRPVITELHVAWQETDDVELRSDLANVIGLLKPDAALVGARLKEFNSGVPAAGAPAPEEPAPVPEGAAPAGDTPAAATPAVE